MFVRLLIPLVSVPLDSEGILREVCFVLAAVALESVAWNVVDVESAIVVAAVAVVALVVNLVANLVIVVVVVVLLDY